MKRFSGIVSDHHIREAISDLEELSEGAHAISVAAIHVLKDELDPVAVEGERRRILFEQSFSLPGSIRYRLRRRLTPWSFNEHSSSASITRSTDGE